ncbi:MFS transporter [Klebsiella pneumoniae]|uniref:MFS transporter n=1 Tax=Klebsiella pneumoniae TaxID=573 RepID=UPI003EBCDEC4
MTPALRQNLTLAVLVLTGINMRPLLTSIGPLLPDIRAASGMSYTLAALLTALPVIAMGVLALAAGWVDRYIGQKRSIALSLLIIAAGALLREIAPNSGLLLTSALAGGIGIGIIQAAIPAVIKHLFPRRTPLVMGLWSAALMGGAFPLCLVLALDHAGQPAVAGRLVAFMQGIGFIIAGLSPWLSGLLRSLSGNYTLDWSWHAICVLLLMALTLRFIPAHYPAEWRQRASDLP